MLAQIIHGSGDKFGMMGGVVVIEGHAGDRVGDRMRRGTIIVRGRCGAIAGTRMLGGTVWTDQGFGAKLETVRRKGDEASLVAGLGGSDAPADEPPAMEEYPADDDIPESEF